MRLSELIESLSARFAPRIEANAEENPVVRGITYDSRRVAPGDFFVALRGKLADGHDYLADAIRLGAVAVLVEALPPGTEPGSCTVVAVSDTRKALAPLANHFFGFPSRELALVGVTGTNGKTSTTYLIESILAQAGRRVGLIGTLEIRFGDERQTTLNTTPESLDLQRTLRRMRSAGVEAVAMEVSSHGISLGRIDGCRFAVGAVTNVSQDHLDFHGTMDSYRDAKVDFFRNHLTPESTAVVNADDPGADSFLAGAADAGVPTLCVSRRPTRGAEVTLEDARIDLDGSWIRVQLPSGPLEIEVPLVGDFNLENVLVAMGTAVAMGIAPDAIAAGIRTCPQVPGRIERVESDVVGAPNVFVDYAHTPDAIDKLLRTIRPLNSGALITVFGCGGDRDRSKRPLMAEAVARWSDRVVATSDNPRTEDPQAILADVEVGLDKMRRLDVEAFPREASGYAVVVDRRAAIELAIRSATPRDTVVIAGKGHEDYQIIGRERLPFDDRVEARRVIRQRESA